MKTENVNKIVPSVVGLGYVGLPLYVRLKKKYKTIGFDVNKDRINQLKKGIDENKEFSKNNLKNKTQSFFSSKIGELKNSNFFIICVPTPILKNYKPNLKYLIHASTMISKVIKKGDIVFFESTVYPGVTDDICAKIIEKKTKLKKNVDFFVGYSPERINPGDKRHSVDKIKKIVAINTNSEKILKKVRSVYNNVASSIVISNDIKEAEAAKVIENIQRDLNIGLFNEIFKLCEKSSLNYNKVIKLASTKWNFQKYNYGLVGGHCLPVDPYYLSYYAKKNKLNLDIVLAGRKTNNGMYNFFLKYIKKKLKLNTINFKSDSIGFYGITYKKNVPDTRNSIPIKIIKHFNSINKNIYIRDDIVESNILSKLKFKSLNSFSNIKCLIILVKHDKFEIPNSLKKKIYILDLFNN